MGSRYAPRHNSDWWLKHDASRMVVRIWFLRLHFFARILHVMPEVEVRSPGPQTWLNTRSGTHLVTAAHLQRSFPILALQHRPQVLLTDTDVCFYASPFESLRRMNHAIVLNGVPDAINIGLIYAHKTLASPPHTFDLFRCAASGLLLAVRRRTPPQNAPWLWPRRGRTRHVHADSVQGEGDGRCIRSEIARRQAAFRLAGVDNPNVTGQNAQVFWDQALVNDVLHEWIAPNLTSYARSCWLGFGAKGQNHTCFSECCLAPHPFGLKPGQRDESGSLAQFVHETFRCAPLAPALCSVFGCLRRSSFVTHRGRRALLYLNNIWFLTLSVPKMQSTHASHQGRDHLWHHVRHSAGDCRGGAGHVRRLGRHSDGARESVPYQGAGQDRLDAREAMLARASRTSAAHLVLRVSPAT